MASRFETRPGTIGVIAASFLIQHLSSSLPFEIARCFRCPLDSLDQVWTKCGADDSRWFGMLNAMVGLMHVNDDQTISGNAL